MNHDTFEENIMRKKIGSIALAGALAASIAAPAPAMVVENTSVEYAGTVV
ncbi:hypothetical protein [Corynebacterium ammoniagenes]|nr:hypothetical protein [Corynebacterium ammoniagenes]EFG81256.1 hypothetical protein HMPREF0281_01428 [Corynebacterium ammoniagenes DSM 20306]